MHGARRRRRLAPPTPATPRGCRPAISPSPGTGTWSSPRPSTNATERSVGRRRLRRGPGGHDEHRDPGSHGPGRARTRRRPPEIVGVARSGSAISNAATNWAAGIGGAGGQGRPRRCGRRACASPATGHHRPPVLGLSLPGGRGPGGPGGDAGHRPAGRRGGLLLRPVRGLHPAAWSTRPTAWCWAMPRAGKSTSAGRRSSTAASGCSLARGDAPLDGDLRPQG